MNDSSYLPRVADSVLSDKLEAMGAVLIEGPKWCGKTTTAEQQAASVIKMQDTEYKEQYLATALTRPSQLLVGTQPRLIDEWQDAPMLWDAVRAAVDKEKGAGHYILTGSNSVDRKQLSHSGTGRIARMRMLPMSLWESGDSNGQVSLSYLFDHPNEPVFAQTDVTIPQLIFLACRGGWPATLFLKTDKARRQVAHEYIESVATTDMTTIDGVKRNPQLVKQILKSYSRNLCTLANRKSIWQDTLPANESLSVLTFDSYINALKQLFIIDEIEAWNPAIRSATAIRSAWKRNIVDPSLAIAALNLTPDSFQYDLKTFGFIFECMAIRDIKAYSQTLGGQVAYYHDRYDLEADIVLHLSNDKYALIECKLGSREIDEGASHLLKIEQLIVKHNQSRPQMPMRMPDLKIILTGGSMAYTRQDGVYVIPLACLKP